mmetsp:Transcript_34373/g.67685  ORF Transcript_34373/g.67685 Transcript_34373/m.67685 type:complete len:287 (-) Transcript_34373:4-864(-)
MNPILQPLRPWPRSACGRFACTVDELLEVAVAAEHVEAVPQATTRLRQQCRALQRRMQDFASAADILEDEAVREVEGLKDTLISTGCVQKNSLGSLPMSVVIEARAIAKLCVPGVLGPALEIEHAYGGSSIAGLGVGWQLLGGLALETGAAAAGDIPPFPLEPDAAMVRICELSCHWGRVALAVSVPMLDAVVHQAERLERWRAQNATREGDKPEKLRCMAQDRLHTSMAKERKRLMTLGFDPADSSAEPLQMPHLEKRVAWCDYHAAQRVARYYQRRKQSTTRCL